MVINDIINTFYLLSKEHKLIRSFKYDRISKGAGIGEELYPQCFLEDPIYIGDSTLNNGSVICQVSFDIVMIPQAFENYDKKQLTVEDCQSIAHEIALSYIARMRNMSINYDEYEGKDYAEIKPLSWNFITLRNWYDNRAAGIRCTLNLSLNNPINICDVEENFDENKEFNLDKLLSDVNTDDAESCVSFGYKLPQFKLD